MLRQVRAAAAERDDEGGALAGAALGANSTAVKPDELVDECEPDAGTFDGAGADPFDAVEALEHPGQLFGRNPRPGVAHGELGAPFNRHQLDGDRAFEGELERV